MLYTDEFTCIAHEQERRPSRPDKCKRDNGIRLMTQLIEGRHFTAPPWLAAPSRATDHVNTYVIAASICPWRRRSCMSQCLLTVTLCRRYQAVASSSMTSLTGWRLVNTQHRAAVVFFSRYESHINVYLTRSRRQRK